MPTTQTTPATALSHKFFGTPFAATYARGDNVWAATAGPLHCIAKWNWAKETWRCTVSVDTPDGVGMPIYAVRGSNLRSVLARLQRQCKALAAAMVATTG